MARTKARAPVSINELRKNWVWCIAGSSVYIKKKKWIHWKTCKARQAKTINDCVAVCPWYRAYKKLEDPKERATAGLITFIDQRETKSVKADLGNKKRLKKYLKSIPKVA